MDTLPNLDIKINIRYPNNEGMNTTGLINKINKLGKVSYQAVSLTRPVIKDIKSIKNKFAKIDEENCDRFIELLTAENYLKVDARKELITLKKPIINAIKRYAEEYNNEPNEDKLDGEKTEEEIEELLDQKIPSYNRYTEKNPMHGVGYCNSKKLWRFQKDEVDKTSKNLTNIVEMAKSTILSKAPGGLEKDSDYTKKIQFTYQNHYFMSYWYEGAPHFDIQHIISVLNLKSTSWHEKYNGFSEKISYLTWHENKYKGYILRELIDETTMYELILSSNSDISKTLKKDVAKILVELRKSGKLDITNDKIAITDKPITTVKEVKPISLAEDYPVLSYENPDDILHVRSLIKTGTKITLSKYLDYNVMYAFVAQIKTPHKDVIIKIGYTEDIAKRYKSLKAEYKCDIYLINIRFVSGRKDEEAFHEMMKIWYIQLMEPYSVKSKEKHEFYKYSPIIMNLLNGYNRSSDKPTVPGVKTTPGDFTDEQIDFIDDIKKQDISYYQYMTEIKMFEGITNEKNKYNYLMEKEKNLHARLLNDQEIRLVEIDKEKETRLAEIDKEKETRLAEINKEIRMTEINKEKEIKIAEIVKDKDNEKEIKIAEIAKDKDIEIAKIKWLHKDGN
jgi:prophage antirepressor-like protein